MLGREIVLVFYGLCLVMQLRLLLSPDGLSITSGRRHCAPLCPIIIPGYHGDKFRGCLSVAYCMPCSSMILLDAALISASSDSPGRPRPSYLEASESHRYTATKDVPTPDSSSDVCGR